MSTARKTSKDVDRCLSYGSSKGIYYLKYSMIVIFIEVWWLYSICMGIQLQLKYLHLTAVLAYIVKWKMNQMQYIL